MPTALQATPCTTFTTFLFCEDEWELIGESGPIVVQHKALELLAVLSAQPQQVVTTAELMDALWPDTMVTEQSLRQAIRKLRVALGDEKGELVVTVHGRGVKLDAVTRHVERSAPHGATRAQTGPLDKPCRVALVDDHTLFRSSLSLLLQSRPECQVVGEASTRAEALALAETVRPDLMLMDVDLGDASGVDVTSEILRKFPEIKVILLTGRVDWPTIAQGIAVGVKGVLSKAVDPAELVRSIHAAAHGDVALTQDALKALFAGLTRGPEGA